MEHAPARTLSAQRIKVTLVLDAAELISIPAPEGQPRVTLRVAVAGRTVTADIAAKSLRKAQGAIREAGADGVAVILQGSLGAGDVLSEAGLTAQLKAKPAAPSVRGEIRPNLHPPGAGHISTTSTELEGC